jgi:hypothetical protein
MPPYCKKRSVFESRRRSWIGHLFGLFCGSYVLGSVVPAGLLYGGGLLAATAAGFATHYLDSRIWLLAGVTAWVLAWGERSDRYLAILPMQIRGALRDAAEIAGGEREGERETYEQLVERWHMRLYSFWRSLAWSSPLIVVLEYLTIWNPDFWTKRLPPEWSTASHVAWAKGILGVYFLVGGFLAGTMFLGFAEYLRFSRAVLRRRLALNLSLARASLRHITVFGLETGFGWSIAVALAAAFFAGHRSAVATTGLVFLALMGFALILVPQVLAHEALTRARDGLLVETLGGLDSTDEAEWVTRFVRNADEKTLRLRAFGAELDQFPLWIYSPAEATSFVAEVVATVAAIFALLHVG